MENKKPKRIIAPRVKMPCQPAEVRNKNFEEVATGYTKEMAMKEAARCLQCKKPKCILGCPVEVPIKEFIAKLIKDDLHAAYSAIKSTNSLPAVCGRVCPQEIQCEKKCVLSAKGQPVAIGRLERYVADAYSADSACDQVAGKDTCAVQHPHLKVACLGAGPASLTAAGYLASNGLKVDVFEALHEPGGVLVYGIPAFRLPKDIVSAEVNGLKELGVEFKLNWVAGRTMTIDDLFEQGYKAIFIGVGAGLPTFLNIPGENLIGVLSANEYLTRVNLGRAYDFPNFDTPVYIGKKVTVFGAGNVAMDAARTALRLGAETVHIVYRRSKVEIPARSEEVDHAIEEGVQFEILAAPLKFNGDSNMYLQSVTLQKMELGEPDASGRRRPVPIDNAIYQLDTDLAIVALGTRANPILLDATPDLGKNKWGYVVANEETGETTIPNVFAGGDIVTGSATVILAMGAGRCAAQEITRRLLG